MHPDGASAKKILVVGCGGVGSEVLKLFGCCNGASAAGRSYDLTIVDYDRVETSNLSRQFLYRVADRGLGKAAVAASRTGASFRECRLQELKAVWLDQFDAVIACLDNVPGRMELNYLFKRSRCPLLVDCGVEGLQAHAKLVTREGPCLYCIRDLYSSPRAPNLCSLRNTEQKVDAASREKILLSLIYKTREELTAGGADALRTPANSDALIAQIVARFNEMASAEHRTDNFEVRGHFEQIVPNVCTINAICASLAVRLLERKDGVDFLFYNGASFPAVSCLRLEKDSACVLCRQPPL
ncbi:NEDD8-activating enzyme E1 [Pancytospora philotis]|nr:NEDD8-activating enzyme E1 [Pancytospora philotis]